METGENLIGKVLDISEISRFAKFVKVMKIRDSIFEKGVKTYHVRKCSAKGKEFVDENGFTCKFIDENIAKGIVTVYESTYAEPVANQSITGTPIIGETYLSPRYYSSKRIILHPGKLINIADHKLYFESIIDGKTYIVPIGTKLKSNVSAWFKNELKKATDDYNIAKDYLITIRNKSAKNGIELTTSIN
ncbi:MAG: hypothetical protein WC979_02515 [Candidatus Pacearchaeota archaeon]|jgi:hypothetical protein|nr:hypothetical protein [Clostridia bacterium]